MKKIYVSRSAEQTKALGKELGSTLHSGDVVALFGGLGSGKTVFVKGIAAALGIDDDILSPTFTLLREYGDTPRLNHFDLYRIEDEEELMHIGFYDYLCGEGICVIEWAEKVQDLSGTIRVYFEGSGSDDRIIKITGRERDHDNTGS